MGHKLDNQIKKAPKKPGIYIFKNKAGEFLYIGKAGNLKNRVRQYLRPDPERPFLKHLMNEAEKVDFKTTSSEIEALILESRLIKEKQPKYNVMFRDGKQYFYIGITKDEFPRLFLTHQPYKIAGKKFKTQKSNFKSNPNVLKLKIENLNLSYQSIQYIGPFTDGNALKTTLRLLRRVFPYCTCLSARDPAKRDKQKHNNFCLNYHIGKCLGICCLKQQSQNSNFQFSIFNESKKYRKNIKAVKEILSGKKDVLLKSLRKELISLGKNQEFEKAIELRDKIEKLEKIFANAKIIQDAKYGPGTAEAALERLVRIFKLIRLPGRIEGYDISNIQGQNAVGAMVVFVAGQPDKNEYRKFKIYLKEAPDDTAMLKEVLLRRFIHPEWPKPDLIFIDGGKGQLNAAKNAIAKPSAFAKASADTAIISLAKGKQEVFSTTLKKPVSMKKLPPEVRNLILHIDSEAHRFAISYYRKIHRRKILE